MFIVDYYGIGLWYRSDACTLVISCPDMSDFAVGVHFEDFKSAEEAVVAFCRQNYHPVRHDSKETFRAANKKLSAKNRVLDMPEDAVFACRLVFGKTTPTGHPHT